MVRNPYGYKKIPVGALPALRLPGLEKKHGKLYAERAGP